MDDERKSEPDILACCLTMEQLLILAKKIVSNGTCMACQNPRCIERAIGVSIAIRDVLTQERKTYLDSKLGG